MSSSCGPSLPPRVVGKRIGTFTIHLLTCSTTRTYARVQLWGEPMFSYILPLTSEPAPHEGSNIIEYPLVGSVSALKSYFNDASPIRVDFFHQNHKNQQQHQKMNNKRSITRASDHHAFIGCSHISELCLDRIPCHGFQNEKMELSFLRRLKITHPGDPCYTTSTTEKHQKIQVVGEALFKLDFEITLELMIVAPIACMPSTNAFNKECNATRRSLPEKNAAFALLYSSNNYCNCDQTYSIQVESENQTELNSSSCTSIDKQSLLDELLNLVCNDELTIPTIGSSSECASYTDTCTLRRKGVTSTILKLQVDEMSMVGSFADKFIGKVLYLQYIAYPFLSELGVNAELIKIKMIDTHRLVEEKGQKSKLMKIKEVLAKKHVENVLQKIAHVKHFQVNFNDVTSVRRWINSTLTFSLFCLASDDVLLAQQPQKLSQAGANKLGGKKTAISDSVSNVGKILLAKASFQLKNVILSETLSFSGKLDLISSTKSKLSEDILSKQGSIIGALSIHFALISAEQNPSCSSNPPGCSMIRFLLPQKEDVNAWDSVKLPYTCSEWLNPHPISILLSHYVESKNDDNHSCIGDKKNITQEEDVLLTKVSNSNTTGLHDDEEEETNLCDKSILSIMETTDSPNWLWVRVDKASQSILDIATETKRLKLAIVCDDHYLPLSRRLQAVQRTHLLSKQACGNNIALPISVCSWQFPLMQKQKLVKDMTVTLMLLHCQNTSDSFVGTGEEELLIGSAKIPFCDSPLGSLMDPSSFTPWFPDVVVNGPLDVVDTKTNKYIGILEVVVASGTMQQVTNFSVMYKSILTIQRWWVRKRTTTHRDIKSSIPYLQKPRTTPEINIIPPSCLKQVLTQTSSDTICNGFMHVQHGKEEEKEEFLTTTSSPDSLFEERSVQSICNTSKREESKYRHTRNERCCKILDISASSSSDEDSLTNSLLILEEKATHEDRNAHHQMTTSLTSKQIVIDCVEEAAVKQCCSKHQTSPITLLSQSNNHVNDKGCNYQCNDIMLSCLKPLNLEGGFSKEEEQKNDTRGTNMGIDPPEDINICCKNKPKIEKSLFIAHGSSTLRDDKRYQGMQEIINNECFNPLQKGALHDHDGSILCCATQECKKDMMDEVESSPSSKSSSSHYHHCEDYSGKKETDEDETTVSYRSLTSVLGTLDRINSIFSCGEGGVHNIGKYNPLNNRKTNHHCLNEVVAQHQFDYDLEDVNIPTTISTTFDGNFVASLRPPRRRTERPDPGRQREPPEENLLAIVPVILNNDVSPSNNVHSPVVKFIQMCDKGNSPLRHVQEKEQTQPSSLACCVVNATSTTTSPPTSGKDFDKNIIITNTRITDDGRRDMPPNEILSKEERHHDLHAPQIQKLTKNLSKEEEEEDSLKEEQADKNAGCCDGKFLDAAAEQSRKEQEKNHVLLVEETLPTSSTTQQQQLNLKHDHHPQQTQYSRRAPPAPAEQQEEEFSLMTSRRSSSSRLRNKFDEVGVAPTRIKRYSIMHSSTSHDDEGEDEEDSAGEEKFILNSSSPFVRKYRWRHHHFPMEKTIHSWKRRTRRQVIDEKGGELLLAGSNTSVLRPLSIKNVERLERIFHS